MTLTFNENLAKWEIMGIGYGTFYLVESGYPNFDGIIPDTGHIFKIPSRPVLDVLGPLGIIAKGYGGRDTIIVKANGSLNLNAYSEAIGNADAQLPCQHLAVWTPPIVFNPDPEVAADRSGVIESISKGLITAFNISYFEDCIKLGMDSPDESVLMSGTDTLNPSKFWIEGSPRITVLMPVRLPE